MNRLKNIFLVVLLVFITEAYSQCVIEKQIKENKLEWSISCCSLDWCQTSTWRQEYEEIIIDTYGKSNSKNGYVIKENENEVLINIKTKRKFYIIEISAFTDSTEFKNDKLLNMIQRVEKLTSTK